MPLRRYYTIPLFNRQPDFIPLFTFLIQRIKRLLLTIDTVFVLVLKRCRTKVNQQTVVYSRRSEIVDKLRLMGGVQCHDRLKFQYQTVLHHDIRPVITYADAFVDDRDGDFLLRQKPRRLQLAHQGIFLHFLKVSGAEVSMHGHCRPNYFVAYFIYIHNS